MNKRCIICDKEFNATTGNQISCSKKCSGIRDSVKQKECNSKKHIPKKKKCIICGKMFVRPGTNAVTCGDECAEINNDKKRRIYAQKVRGNYPKKLGDERKCVVCSEKFIRISTKQKTCSKECSKKNGLIKRRVHYPKYSPPPAYRKCIICGKEFRQVTNKKTCSKECAKIPIWGDKTRWNVKNRDKIKRAQQEEKQVQQFFQAIAMAGAIAKEA